MLKKLFSILAILMMAMTAWAETYTDAAGVEWQKVATPAEFKTQVKADGNILLTADIDLSQITPEKSDQLFNHEFKGKINGKYIKAVGDTIVSKLKNSRVVFFEKMTGATIENVLISDCYFDGWDSGSGQIACEASNCYLTNVTMLRCSSVGDRNAWDCDKMGGVIGNATGCHFTNVKALNCSMQTDGEMAGLLVGVASGCEFDRCVSNLMCSIWADGNSTLAMQGNAYVGGICGYASNTTFTNCANLAMVGARDDRAGGIVGYGEGVTMTDCENYGIVSHTDLAGFLSMKNRQELMGTITLASLGTTVGLGTIVYIGLGSSFEAVGAAIMVGLTYTAGAFIGVTIAAAVVYGIYSIIVANYEPDEIGGIAGCIKSSSTVTRCSNYGPLDCYDAHCGGIVGYADGSTIKMCLNQAFVTAQEQAGGIVGYANGCTVQHNLSMGAVKTDVTTGGMIVGDNNGGNTISGNYFLARTADSNTGAVTQEQLASGEVTMALNQAITSIDANNTDVFRQDLGKSIYPTLDPNAPVVTDTTTSYNLWQQVKNADEFMRAVTNLTAKIELTADIDMTSSVLFSLFSANYPFYGEIKGNGHVIKNLIHEVSVNKYDDDKDVNAALFAYAENAKFENFTIQNFKFTQADDDSHNVEAFLVANSKGCTYTNIHIKESSICYNDDKEKLHTVGGFVAKSDGDTFTGCSLDGHCKLQVYIGTTADALLGGIAGTATNSKFYQCYNDAELWADNDKVGGIVGYLQGGSIDRCLNTGGITAREYVGGIAGYVMNAPVTHCVNTGWLDDDDLSRDDYRAGIVGALDGSSASVSYCINYGSVNYAEESTCSPINNKRDNGASYGDGNYFYCQFNGVHTGNITEVTWNNMLIGEYALNMTDGSNHWLYQSIDNNNDFPTNMPVPIPAAGQVYSNVLCDGTQSYSNIYQSTSAHTGVEDSYGKCKTCGKFMGTPATVIHICDANDMIDLARNVNSGVDFSASTIYLDNDIDMGGYSYTPIGKGFTTPFKGTFDGKGHRIKNLTAYSTQNCLGTFGCVAGTTTIRNLIIDSSCQFVGTGYGSAGIVGCMARPQEGLSDAISLTLENCGNEANVSGETNAAGLVGGVYNTETYGNATVTITNCYNTGNIVGTGVGGKESAALIAYGNSSVTVKNCYNTGVVVGYESNHSLIRYKSTASVVVDKVYNLSTVATDEKAVSATATDFISGKVCSLLNTNASAPWGQRLSSEYTPQLAYGGNGTISYSGTMANQWGTLVLPFNVTYDAENTVYKLYHLTAADSDKLTFAEYTSGTIIAGTPMVIKAIGDKNAAGKYAINIPAGENAISTTITEQNATNAGLPQDWKMTGTFSGVASKSGIYFIANNLFWWAESPITIAPFRAWFTGPTPSNGAPALNIEIEEESENGISELKAESGKQKEGKIIENGKVVIVRNGVKYSISGQSLR